MESFEYVIIGGGQGGGGAAIEIRKLDPTGRLILVTEESHAPYQRPPLSKKYLMGQAGREKVYLKDPDYYREHDIKLATGTRATELDAARRTVTLDDGRVLKYETLLLATGGRALRLPIPGGDLANVFTLRTIEDSEAIQEASGPGKRAVVLGGSFIGSEVASSLNQLGTDVTMVFPESRILERVVPQELSEWLHALYQSHGVRILAGQKPARLEGSDAVERVVLESGETLDADLVVMGVGIRLNTELGRQAGLEVGQKDALVVDEYLRTSDPHIYAVGDIAAWPDPTSGRRLQVEHWDVAEDQGERAGRNMAGDPKPYTSLPYFFSDLFDLSFDVWGSLDFWDQTVLRGDLDSGSYAFYYFDQDRLVGVLAVARPDEEREPMKALVRHRPTYAAVAAKLADEKTNLEDLV